MSQIQAVKGAVLVHVPLQSALQQGGGFKTEAHGQIGSGGSIGTHPIEGGLHVGGLFGRVAQAVVGGQQYGAVLGLHAQMIAEGHLLQIAEPAQKVQIPQAGIGIGGIQLADQIGRNHRGLGQIGLVSLGGQRAPIIGDGLLVGIDLHLRRDGRFLFRLRLFVSGQRRDGTQAKYQQTDGDAAKHGKPPRETGGFIPA